MHCCSSGSFKHIDTMRSEKPEIAKLLRLERILAIRLKKTPAHCGRLYALECTRVCIARVQNASTAKFLYLKQRIKFQGHWYQVIHIAEYVLQCVDLDNGRMRELRIGDLAKAELAFPNRRTST